MPNNNFFYYTTENERDISRYLKKSRTLLPQKYGWKTQATHVWMQTVVPDRAGATRWLMSLSMTLCCSDSSQSHLLWRTRHPPSQQQRLLYVTITVRKWYFGRAVAVRHRGLISLRLILDKPDPPVSLPPLLAFSIIIEARIGLLAFHWHWTNTRLSPSLSSRRCDRYIVQPNLLPPRQESVNFCFTLCLFQGKKKKTSNGGYIKQRSRSLWSGFECNELTWH